MPYEILQIGALLRKLLADGHSLAARAAAPFRFKYHFRAHQFDEERTRGRFGGAPMIQHGPVIQGGAMIPGRDVTPLVELPPKMWLKHTVAMYYERPVSVGEVIDYIAHVAGGVHDGHPKSDIEHVFDSLNFLYLDRPFREYDGGAPGALVSIAVITRSALSPLYSHVLQAYDQTYGRSPLLNQKDP